MTVWLPELGQFALGLALTLAVAGLCVTGVGLRAPASGWLALMRPLAVAQSLLVITAFGILVALFVGDDFSVRVVAMNANRALPVAYKVTATWGNHEGSLLLWAAILGGWTIAVAGLGGRLPVTLLARVLATMQAIAVGFLAFSLFTSNPFARTLPDRPMDGQDLNPLLQDFAMILHPPTLYCGYVGLSVAFAFAVAALLEGRLDARWARWTQPWTLAAWVFLTLGIALGSWWAYYELGWGGWWFWDPVENASLMPWLAATALIHSLRVTIRRDSFQGWTVLLAIVAFSLSLLGTFLVRSGVLTSVHAFASDPTRGVFILVFLGLVIGLSLLLYAVRAPVLRRPRPFALFSRESLLLLNNLLLLVAALTVLLGTIFPLLMDALNLGRYSVGPPYFNGAVGPVLLAVAALLGLAPWAGWQRTPPGRVTMGLVTAAVAALVVTGGLLLLVGTLDPWLALGWWLAVWIVMLTAVWVWRRLRAGDGIPAPQVPMLVAHLGVAVCLLGVLGVSVLSLERDVRLRPGESVSLGGYDFVFQGVRAQNGPNYRAQRGHVRVRRGETVLAELYPEKRFYHSGGNPMTEAAIAPGLWRDLYVALGEPLDESGAWAVRVHIKPLVRLVWLGAVLMALGGVLAVRQGRRERRAEA